MTLVYARGRVLGRAALVLSALALALAVSQGERGPRARAVAPPLMAQPIVEGVKWPDISLPVVVDLSALTPEWQAAARGGLAAWNGGGSRFWYVEAPAEGAPFNAVRFEVVERLMACGGQWQPTACTYPFIYQFAPQHLSHVVIQLGGERLRADAPRRPLDVVDLPALFTHELGHALGLGEAASPTAAMFPGALWAALGDADRQELRGLYGTVEGPRPADAPTLTQPRDGDTAHPASVLRWEPLPNAVGYYLQVASADVYEARGGFVDVSFGEYAVDTTTESAEYVLPPGLAGGREYRWRVKARTATGNSPWSPAARFALAAGGPR